MIAFIEDHRGEFGVEPMCRMLQIAPSTYYERRAIARDPDRASARAKSDAELCIKINAAWEDNRKLYGARKIWHVLLRDNQDVARCTVERLMRHLGLKGVLRGKKVITTNPDTSQACPDDKVNRVFKADRPNQLWVSDFTYVQTWSGTVYVAARPLFLNQWRTRSRSSMSLRAASSAGASRHPWRHNSFSMLWSKRSGKEKHRKREFLCTFRD